MTDKLLRLLSVTDMLVAVLNTCTKEELEEESSDEEEEIVSPVLSPIAATGISPEEASDQRRKVIKNKIMAVGRVARVFALLRCVSGLFISGQIADRILQRGCRKSLGTEEYIWFEQIAVRNFGFWIRRNQECY